MEDKDFRSVEETPRSVEDLVEQLSATNKTDSQELQVAQTELEEQKEVADLTSQQVLLELEESEDIIRLRREWSSLFKAVVIVILTFEIGLTLGVGTGVLQFADEWFVRIIISGGIAQILAMPYLVTKFLFSPISLHGNVRVKELPKT